MSFDTLAPFYRWMEFILAGEKLQRCRTTFLREIPSAKNVLLLGEGHGRALVECRRKFPAAQITCIDASPVMLAQASLQLRKSNLSTDGIQFVTTDVTAWTSCDAIHDLIVTNFFLDCFRADQLEKIIPGIARSSLPSANWLLADFQVAPGGWKRRRSQLILAMMYGFFRMATSLPARRLTPPDPFLEHAGFRLHERAVSDWGLLHSDWWRKTELV